MTEPYTLYKLIVLYMMQKVSFPLSNSQISDFVLEKGYTSYFHLQEAINELLESKLIERQSVQNTSYYKLTPEGETTLSYFSTDISPEIRGDIDDYLIEKEYDLRNESSTLADYYKIPEGEYNVRCQVREGKNTIIDLTITVPDEDDAKRVCQNWPTQCQTLYAEIMKSLLIS